MATYNELLKERENRRKSRFLAALKKLPGDYKNLAKETGSILKSFARAAPRAAVAVGGSIGEEISEKILKRPLNEQERSIKAKSKVERFLLGDEPVRTISLQKERTKKFLGDVGVGQKTAKFAATPLVFAGTLLDLVPGFGGAGKKGAQKAFVEIAGSKELPSIIKSLKTIGVKGDDLEINKLAQTLKEVDNPKQVEDIVTSLGKKEEVRQAPQDVVGSILGKLKKTREEQEAVYSAERSKRLGMALKAGENIPGTEGVKAQLSQLKGEMQKVNFDSLKKLITPEEKNQLLEMAKRSSDLTGYEKIRAQVTLEKLFGEFAEEIPTRSEISTLEKILPQEFIDIIDDMYQPDLVDKFAEYSTAVKLWNPTTHIVNFGGNALRQITDAIVTTAVNIGKPGLIKADLSGAMKGLGTGLKNAFKAISNEAYARKLSKFSEVESTVKPAIGGKIGEAVRIPFRALGATDEVFRAMGFQRNLYRQAYRSAKAEGLTGAKLQSRMDEILNNPTKEMVEQATEESKKLTFQEDMGEIVEKINKFRTPSEFKSTSGKLASLVFRVFVPFLKTPTNLLKQGIDFSPFGFIKNFPEVKAALKAGNKEKAGKLIGEAVLGTALTAFIVNEFQEGNITGGAPREAKERDQFYREGKLPYAIKVGDRWYQYKRVEPFATNVGMVADIMTLKEEGDIKPAAVINSIVNQMSDKTYLQGISELLTLFTGEDYEKENVINNMVTGSLLPSFVGTIARTVDPTVRDTETFIDKAKSQIPGLSKELPAKIDVLGYDIERANKGLSYLFNPIQTTEAEIDPITRTLMKMEYNIPIPQRFFQEDKVKYELTPEEYSAYARFVGIKLRNQLSVLVATDEFKRKSNAEKIKQIEKIRSKAMDEWQKRHIEKGSAPKRPISEVINSLNQ